MSKQDNLHDYVTDIAGTIRSVEGSTEKINAQDFSDRIKAISKTGGAGGKTTPSFTSGRANKIIIPRKSETSSFYPRWAETVSNAYLFTNNSVINIDTDTWSFGLPTVLINAEQEGVDDVGDLIAAHIKDTENSLIVFYKANNLTEPTSYSIIGKIFRNNAFIPNLIRTIDGRGSLHQPFVFDNYVYYTEKSEDGTRRDIKRVKIDYTISGGVVQTFDLNAPEIVISGKNNIDDNRTSYLSAHLGSPVVARLTDGNLIIVYDSDVNRDLGYPYTIQYSYSTDDGATWEEGKTLFKTTGYNNKAPYVVVDPFGKVAISYHTNNEYIENSDGTDTIFDYVFKAFISSGTIYCGDTLTPADFVEIPISRNQANEWTGGYGSLAIINGEVAPVYAHGLYNNNQGTIIDTIEASSPKVEQIEESSGLVVYAHENYAEKTIAAKVEAISDSIVRRNSSGFVYGSTATNLDPTNQPTILTTKAYVANFGNANYLPLTGGTISGNLNISGNLIVAGESIISEAEHLKVKDAIIETNSEGNNIPTISGLVIHKNKTDTYIIGYDPTNDSVKLGFGEQDANKNWVFKENDGNPIATRADASLMTNNGIALWDNTKHRFIAKDMTNLNLTYRNTTVAYDTTDGMTINGQARFTYGGSTNKDVTMGIDVPIVAGEGITIDKKSTEEKVEVKLDTAFTDGKYVKSYVGIPGTNLVYMRQGDHDSFVSMNVDNEPGSIAQRKANCTLKVGTAVEDSDAMTKKQVEDGFVAKKNNPTYKAVSVLDKDSSGNWKYIWQEFNTDAKEWTFPIRAGGGVVRVGTPVRVNDATTKAYVDNLNTITITAGA